MDQKKKYFKKVSDWYKRQQKGIYEKNINKRDDEDDVTVTELTSSVTLDDNIDDDLVSEMEANATTMFISLKPSELKKTTSEEMSRFEKENLFNKAEQLMSTDKSLLTDPTETSREDVMYEEAVSEGEKDPEDNMPANNIGDGSSGEDFTGETIAPDEDSQKLVDKAQSLAEAEVATEDSKSGSKLIDLADEMLKDTTGSSVLAGQPCVQVIATTKKEDSICEIVTSNSTKVNVFIKVASSTRIFTTADRLKREKSTHMWEKFDWGPTGRKKKDVNKQTTTTEVFDTICDLCENESAKSSNKPKSTQKNEISEQFETSTGFKTEVSTNTLSQSSVKVTSQTLGSSLKVSTEIKTAEPENYSTDTESVTTSLTEIKGKTPEKTFTESKVNTKVTTEFSINDSTESEIGTEISTETTVATIMESKIASKTTETLEEASTQAEVTTELTNNNSTKSESVTEISTDTIAATMETEEFSEKTSEATETLEEASTEESVVDTEETSELSNNYSSKAEIVTKILTETSGTTMETEKFTEITSQVTKTPEEASTESAVDTEITTELSNNYSTDSENVTEILTESIETTITSKPEKITEISSEATETLEKSSIESVVDTDITTELSKKYFTDSESEGEILPETTETDTTEPKKLTEITSEATEALEEDSTESVVDTETTELSNNYSTESESVTEITSEATETLEDESESLTEILTKATATTVTEISSDVMESSEEASTDAKVSVSTDSEKNAEVSGNLLNIEFKSVTEISTEASKTNSMEPNSSTENLNKFSIQFPVESPNFTEIERQETKTPKKPYKEFEVNSEIPTESSIESQTEAETEITAESLQTMAIPKTTQESEEDDSDYESTEQTDFVATTNEYQDIYDETDTVNDDEISENTDEATMSLEDHGVVEHLDGLAIIPKTKKSIEKIRTGAHYVTRVIEDRTIYNDDDEVVDVKKISRLEYKSGVAQEANTQVYGSLPCELCENDNDTKFVINYESTSESGLGITGSQSKKPEISVGTSSVSPMSSQLETQSISESSHTLTPTQHEGVSTSVYEESKESKKTEISSETGSTLPISNQPGTDLTSVESDHTLASIQHEDASTSVNNLSKETKNTKIESETSSTSSQSNQPSTESISAESDHTITSTHHEDSASSVNEISTEYTKAESSSETSSTSPISNQLGTESTPAESSHTLTRAQYEDISTSVNGILKESKKTEILPETGSTSLISNQPGTDSASVQSSYTTTLTQHEIASTAANTILKEISPSVSSSTPSSLVETSISHKKTTEDEYYDEQSEVSKQYTGTIHYTRIFEEVTIYDENDNIVAVQNISRLLYADESKRRKSTKEPMDIMYEMNQDNLIKGIDETEETWGASDIVQKDTTHQVAIKSSTNALTPKTEAAKNSETNSIQSSSKIRGEDMSTPVMLEDTSISLPCELCKKKTTATSEETISEEISSKGISDESDTSNPTGFLTNTEESFGISTEVTNYEEAVSETISNMAISAESSTFIPTDSLTNTAESSDASEDINSEKTVSETTATSDISAESSSPNPTKSSKSSGTTIESINSEETTSEAISSTDNSVENTTPNPTDTTPNTGATSSPNPTQSSKSSGTTTKSINSEETASETIGSTVISVENTTAKPKDTITNAAATSAISAESSSTDSIKSSSKIGHEEISSTAKSSGIQNSLPCELCEDEKSNTLTTGQR